MGKNSDIINQRAHRAPAVARGAGAARACKAGAASLIGAVLLVLAGHAAADDLEPVKLNIVGGLDGINQYTAHEAPFWHRDIRQLSRGAIEASIRPFNRAGLPGPEMLQLIKTGVVSFGTSLVSLVSGDEPELTAIDLPGLNPDVETLRHTVTAFRPFIRARLRERYNAELLGVYTYPAQVVFCDRPFTGLRDLAGRRVRTASIGQSELMRGLGAIPVTIPFADVVSAVSRDVVDCAVTGTLSGNEIGLSGVTTHVHSMAINWGVSLFSVNAETWAALPEPTRRTIAEAVAQLEQRIWQGAARETENGLNCNIGAPSCQGGKPGGMTLVRMTPEDGAIGRKMLVDIILPGWLSRCGKACIPTWNEYFAPRTGVHIRDDGSIVEQARATKLQR